MSRVIKRYDNRKLYDTEDCRYISLEEMATLIRKGVDVQVVDNSSGDDITTQTLTQVIFEEGKRGRNPLSKDLLHNVIRLGNSIIDGSLQQVRQGLGMLVPSSLNRVLNANEAPNSSEDLKQLAQKVESLEAMIKALVNQENVKPEEDSKGKK